MKGLARFRSWVRASLGRTALEESMHDEMRLHLELYEADLRNRGIAPDEARRRARAEFGSVEARKDECREALGLRLVDELRADVTYALRVLRRSPAFFGVALLSLGLGIGANTAIFSLIDTVLLKTLPVSDPHQLAFVDTTGGKSGGNSGPPYPLFERMRDHNRFLAGMAAFSEDRFRVTIDGGAAEQIRGQHASGNYFDLLGVRAVHGRLLTPADDSIFDRGGPDGAAAVISYGFWKRRFNLDPAVLGKSIQVGRKYVTIVGVTQPEFFGLQVGSPIDITVPMMLAGGNVRSAGTWWMSVIGRVKPGASPEAARADLDAMFDPYLGEVGMKRSDHFSGIALVPAAKGLNGLRRSFSTPLLIIMAIVGLVLLICCANLATLLLARANARQQEMAVRLAIGAGRGRLIRQLLTEGLVLVSFGAAAGLLFAWWAVTSLVGFMGRDGQGPLLEPEFNLRVLGFTALVACGTALLFSLAPALSATRGEAAKPATGGTSSARPRVRLGQSLVVMQVTLSLVLLCGAALFLRTFQNLNAVDAGYDRADVLTMVVESAVPGRDVPPTTPAERRQDHARLGAMWEEFIARVQALPGVEAAAVGTMSPMTGRDRGVRVAIAGRAELPAPDRSIHLNQITAAYFDAMGIRLLAGRAFTTRDRAASQRVAILNETAARAYFGAESPIGRRLNFPGQRVEDEYEIVGVVRDARYKNLREPDERMAYIPIEQSIDPITMAAVAVRGAGRGDVTLLLPPVRKTAGAAIPGGFVTRVATIDERIARSLVRERILSTLGSFFGGLALALAAIGLYGLMAYSVTRRTREIGIRIAIGARQHSVIWMVLRETLMLVAAGAAIGTGVALLVGRYVESQLFGVTADDPAVVAAALLLLLAVTAAAGYLPARRASRIDPVIALRSE